jgi:DNA-directed RNA polymerase subunit M/transcription elongation factor TFIIS
MRRIDRSTRQIIIRPKRSRPNTMVVMVTCKNCGHEYKSEVLQTPDEETLQAEPHEDIMENCPKCNQSSSYNGPDFYWD